MHRRGRRGLGRRFVLQLFGSLGHAADPFESPRRTESLGPQALSLGRQALQNN
jgi:hypothetical protein